MFYTLEHSPSLKIPVNKEPWHFHCNQKFASLFKTKRKDSKVLKENISKANNQNKDKHQSIKARKEHLVLGKQNNLFMYNKRKKTKIAHSWKSLKLES